jgi:selenocysteine lyase/cysteine desulfurase
LNVRDDFPYTAECVYLNTAAAGLSWRGQGHAAAAFYENAKGRGMNGMPVWREVADQARTRIARLMGVSATEVRFTSSTTEGLHLALGAIPFERGDEIVVAADEFPSVMLACKGAEARGVVVRQVPVPSESERETAVIDAIGPRTRAVAISHVHWITGTRLDLVRIGAACRERDTFLVVDGAQALGATPIALGDSAFYSASVFKWLISGFGLAVLIVRDHVADRLEPLVRGYNNGPPSRELQYAHVNYPGIYALNASLEYLEHLGWPRIYAEVDTLWSELHSAVTGIGIEIVTPTAAHAGILSCVAPDAARLKETMSRENILIEERGGLLRVSPHFYNNSTDVATLAQRLEDALEQL